MDDAIGIGAAFGDLDELEDREDEDGEEEQEAEESASDENLAEKLNANENARLAQRVIEMVDADLKSREGWVKRFQDGLEACALDGSGGPAAAIDGGATVVHPMIVEAVVQFQARAIAELFPPSGPVKGMVVGEKNSGLEDQARRVESHMNWQMLEEDEGYYADVDSMLMVLPMAGSTFKKTYWDELDRVVTSRFIDAERVIVPYRATSLIRAPRVTHWFELDRYEMGELQDSGFYLSKDRLELQRPMDPGGTKAAADSDAAEASIDDEEDGVHHLYETALRWKLPQDKEWQHYLVTVSRDDTKTLSIRRNSGKRLGRERRRGRFTQYRYLPGLGFYGWGLFHCIGGLGKAATDALRSQLDASAMSTWPGGFATREMKVLGNEIRIKPGVFQIVDATTDDLRNGFFTPPFGKPEQAMVQLLEMLVRAGQRFGSTTEAMVGEGEQNTPVGTTIARIEQASKVYSGIHKRLHMSAAEEFRLRAALNREHLEDEAAFALQDSSLTVYPEDYDDRVDVVPVSDPNIVSTAQRIALAQGALEVARSNPSGYDMAEVERMYLEAMRVPDIDRIQTAGRLPPVLDPVSEGVRAMTGQPLKAYAEQNHQAHNIVHTAFLQGIVGTPAEQIAGPIMQAHIAEHMAQEYRIAMSAQIGINLPDPALTKPGEESIVPPEVQDAIGLAAAQIIAQQQQAQAENPPPDPESILRMAQADKTAAEAAEVKQRVELARIKEESEQAAASQMLQPLMEQLEQARAALEESARRDQKMEQALMNLMATVQNLEEADAEREEATRAKDAQRKDEEKRKAESDRDRAEREKERAALAKQIDLLERAIEDMRKEAQIREEERARVSESSKEERRETEAAADGGSSDKRQPVSVSVGPFVIGQGETDGAEEKEVVVAAPGSQDRPKERTIKIERSKDGGFVGVAAVAVRNIDIKRESDGSFVGTSVSAGGVVKTVRLRKTADGGYVGTSSEVKNP